ncbi:MAG: hypothetical protein ACJAVG_000298, partial [Rickettsiales bacterium]
SFEVEFICISLGLNGKMPITDLYKMIESFHNQVLVDNDELLELRDSLETYTFSEENLKKIQTAVDDKKRVLEYVNQFSDALEKVDVSTLTKEQKDRIVLMKGELSKSLSGIVQYALDTSNTIDALATKQREGINQDPTLTEPPEFEGKKPTVDVVHPEASRVLDIEYTTEILVNHLSGNPWVPSKEAQKVIEDTKKIIEEQRSKPFPRDWKFRNLVSSGIGVAVLGDKDGNLVIKDVINKFKGDPKPSIGQKITKVKIPDELINSDVYFRKLNLNKDAEGFVKMSDLKGKKNKIATIFHGIAHYKIEFQVCELDGTKPTTITCEQNDRSWNLVTSKKGQKNIKIKAYDPEEDGLGPIKGPSSSKPKVNSMV